MSESKKKDINKRTYFQFRCTVAEKYLLKQKAREAGYKEISDYVRDRTLRDTEIVIAANGFMETLGITNAEVGKIGVNMNQVVKAINTTIKSDGEIQDENAKKLSVLVMEYNSIMQELGKQLKNLLRHVGRRRKYRM